METRHLTAALLFAVYAGHPVVGEYVYAGALFPTGCQVPVDATPALTCPDNAQDPDKPFGVPQVNVSMNLRNFQKIDQQAFAFAATVELIMLWVDDGRSVSIGGRLSAEAANHTSSCTKPCFKGTNAAQGCCDRIWLPTLQFDNALPNLASIQEEWYGIDADTFQASDGGSTSFVTYTVRLTATFDQPFDFTAFPFDHHALTVRVSCVMCAFHPLVSQLITRSARGFIQASDTPVETASFGYTIIVPSEDSPHSASAAPNRTLSGRAFPRSSGWAIDSVELFQIQTIDERALTTRPADNLREAPIGAVFSGVAFAIHVHRETRIYYALQTIIPPIILTLVAFSTFLVAKEKFVDRLKALVGLMFPLYIFQFSLSATLPQTFTLLAPNYLVFVSLITLLLMVAIAVVSFIIVARQEHFSWRQKMKKGRASWQKRKQSLKTRAAPKAASKLSIKVKNQSIATQDSVGDLPEVNSILFDHRAGGGYSDEVSLDEGQNGADNATKAAENAPEKDKKEDKKDKDEEHDGQVEVAMEDLRELRPGPLRNVRLRWSAMAFSDVGGYREHLALIFESIALVTLFLIYVASVLAIFLHLDHVGKNTSTA